MSRKVDFKEYYEIFADTINIIDLKVAQIEIYQCDSCTFVNFDA